MSLGVGGADDMVVSDRREAGGPLDVRTTAASTIEERIGVIYSPILTLTASGSTSVTRTESPPRSRVISSAAIL